VLLSLSPLQGTEVAAALKTFGGNETLDLGAVDVRVEEAAESEE